MKPYKLGITIATTLISMALFPSCEKKEQPITLPPKGSSTHGRVDMGENYTYQIFYDFETASIVKTSEVNSWDLAFEAAADGYHVFMNGAKGVLINPSGKTGFADVTSATVDTNNTISGEAWKFDGANGLPEETAVGDWVDPSGASRQQVFVVFADGKFHKMKLLSVDGDKYVMEYGRLDDAAPQTIHIGKDHNFNYTYFSFSHPDHIVTPEPPKASWDIVFTRYRYIYKDLQNFKYIVTGVLTNPYKTTCAEDSISGFANISVSTLPDLDFARDRDVIGFDWKYYDFNSSNAVYIVDPLRCYVIKNRQEQIWKIHFLDFYSPSGVKGSPSFEFERLQ